MAQLFRHHDHAGADGDDILPQIQAEAGRLEALTLPQLAAELMHAAFARDWEPDMSPVMPSHWTLVPDGLSDPKVKLPPDLQTRLRDVAAEGAQLLEHKSLIRLEIHYSGSMVSHGYLSTRAGREALANGTLDQILAEP
jgi:hypothetical protein